MNKLRSTMFVWTIFLALIFGALNTVPALADEGTPPAAETPSVETPPVEESAPPVEETTAELFAALPEGTEVIVLNEEGETVPLVTQEAADVIASSDPQWCPVGVTPGSATCSGVKDSFNGGSALTDLIAWLATPANYKSAAGVIWIDASYTSAAALEGGPVVLNGNNYGTTKNFALTINGGWVSGTTMNPNTPSTFNVPFSIINWNNAVTINNILVEAASGAGYALDVQTTGNVTLTNVDIQDNTTTLGGANIDDSSGLVGNVMVNDSTFNGNSNGDGLLVTTNGTITGKNLSANGNGGAGVWLDNDSAIPPKTVTLTGSNNFKFNGLDGLYISSEGVITLSNVTAIGNTGGSGAYLDNCQGFDGSQFCYNTIASGVTLKGVNVFNNNGWDGLRVWSPGTITVNSVTANDNGTDVGRLAANADPDYATADNYDGYGKGVFLNNWGALTTKAAITLTGTNIFNGNAGNGLLAHGWSTLKANNVTANNNGCNITYDINTTYCAGAYLDGNGVTLTGNNTFVGNTQTGLQLFSYNVAATLNNLYAEGNGAEGVFVYTDGVLKPVNVGIFGTNVFNTNSGNGLLVVANGIATLYNLTANYNAAAGVIVDNTGATTAKAVSILGTNVFNGNTTDLGLGIFSYGAIVTYNITSQFNDLGVILDNCDDNAGTCDAYSPQAVTMNGLNTITDNTVNGLLVVSQGAIKVNNLTATFNGGSGALLDNQYSDSIGGVTLTGYGNLSDNDTFGLVTLSTGAILLNNLTANDNAGFGVQVDNAFNNLKPAAVTLAGLNQFNNNDLDGLTITTFGSVVLNNMTANDNGNPSSAGGVVVDNYASTAAKPATVTLNGINTFNNNFGMGLYINSKGAIVVNKVTATGNDAAGVNLNNQGGGFTSPITLLGYAILNDNNGNGLSAYSNGSITINNLTANFNSGRGAEIDNFYNALPASAVNVIINGVNTFNGNAGDGLKITSDGIITLNNITANDNSGLGAYLDNFIYGNLLKGITMNGNNNFVGNLSSGLYFHASGAVTMMRITSDTNNDGAVGAPASDGIEGIAVGNITLSCGSLTYNEGNGYDLTSTSGIITLKGVFTYGNLLADSHSGTFVTSRTCPLP